MAGSGGAWKVAFADFMTAMMALFLVLWISAQDQKILIATAQYFKNPFNSPINKSSGVMPFNSSTLSTAKGDGQGSQSENGHSAVETVFLNSVAADFQRMLKVEDNLSDKPIDIQVTSDGLRVTLFDRNKRPLFKEGGTEFTEWGLYAIQSLAWMIDRHNFQVMIDGHTRQVEATGKDGYTAWELSADRANAARRSLVHYAVEPKKIERVTGYADTRSLPNETPDSESNERITISLSLAPKPKKAAPTTPELPRTDPEPPVPSIDKMGSKLEKSH